MLKKIPQPVVSRLSTYLVCSQALVRNGKDWVSSSELAEEMGITPATVRRDLSHLSNVGGVRNRGYSTQQLCSVLVSTLGVDADWKALVVGAGNLGKALTLHGGLARQGFSICAVFDCDRRKIGARIGNIEVRPMDQLPVAVSEEGRDIGIITVPFEAAQSVADILIASGIKGLLNLSLTQIAAPERVQVVERRLVAGMLELVHAIKQAS